MKLYVIILVQYLGVFTKYTSTNGTVSKNGSCCKNKSMEKVEDSALITHSNWDCKLRSGMS